MNCNVGKTGQIVRIVIGVAIVLSGLYLNNISPANTTLRQSNG
ncbi:DUF2892 domain-containing protein [Desulfosporosinus sp. Sb-LF]|nr:DUF2892 domain-containing protein [Desulfosporosinus sp. Sb-LF]